MEFRMDGHGYDWLQVDIYVDHLVIQAPTGPVKISDRRGHVIGSQDVDLASVGVLAVQDWFLIQVRDSKKANLLWLANADGVIQINDMNAAVNHPQTDDVQEILKDFNRKIAPFVVDVLADFDIAHSRAHQILNCFSWTAAKVVSKLLELDRETPKNKINHDNVQEFSRDDFDPVAALASLDTGWTDFALSWMADDLQKRPRLSADIQAENIIPIVANNQIVMLRCTHSNTKSVWYALVTIVNKNQMSPVCLFSPRDDSIISNEWKEKRKNVHDIIERFRSVLFFRLWEARHGVRGISGKAKPGFALILQPPESADLGNHISKDMEAMSRTVPVVRRLPPELLKLYALGSEKNVEFYAPLEDIFPEFRGRVLRTQSTTIGAAIDALNNNLLPIVLQDMFVRSDTRNRIVRAVRANRAVELVASAERLRSLTLAGGEGASGARFIVLGLRLQDRTMPTLAQFYCSLIDRLLDLDPGLAFIIDGMNTPDGDRSRGTYRTHTCSDPSELMLAREDAVVQTIRDHVASRRVRIVDCIGSSMAVNVFWASQAVMFVAPHGGGLAKYRWAANIPGFVLASKMNLKHAQPLRLYEDKRVQEDPAAIAYTDAADVTDLFGEDMQFDALGRSMEPWARGFSSVNFQVNQDVVLMKILQFFQRLERPSAGAVQSPPHVVLTAAEE
ncbi:hypothetical protein ACQW02_09325 [Humitalea sp. 24SJ18S-53]|uniref:hypothetical protein n=1 Tax=Humitalea sp. 24SJ18S-53 TaxID=3422307 RepID=UPI003D67CCA5